MTYQIATEIARDAARELFKNQILEIIVEAFEPLPAGAGFKVTLMLGLKDESVAGQRFQMPRRVRKVFFVEGSPPVVTKMVDVTYAELAESPQ